MNDNYEKAMSSVVLADFENLIGDQMNIIKAVNKYNELLRASQKIKFNYTEDEYGRSAKKLHDEYRKTHGKEMINFAYPGDAGFDLPIILSEDEQRNGHGWIWPGERVMLQTGLRFEYPDGYHGRIVHRSSCEKTYRLRVIEGTIDAYRGPILIQVANQNTCQVEITNGMKLAQMIILPNCGFGIEYADKLSDTVRGAKGFGSSTGK